MENEELKIISMINKNLRALGISAKTLSDAAFDSDIELIDETLGHIESQVRGLRSMSKQLKEVTK